MKEVEVLTPSAILMWVTPDPEWTIERAARVCYDSLDKIGERPQVNEKMLRRLRASGHLSCFEQASASFEIICSRACHVQIIRHRTMSYLAQSQRYVKLGGFLPVCVVDPITDDERSFYEHCYYEYQRRIEVGQKPERAREVLPNSTATRMIMTGNFTNWRRFLSARLDPHAQSEVRLVAGQIASSLKKIAPIVFEDVNP